MAALPRIVGGAVLSLAATRAGAQGASPAASPSGAAPTAGAPVTMAVVAGAVREGQWTYSARATANGQTQDFGTRTVALSRALNAEWLLVDAQQNPAATATDSITLAPGSLAAQRRALHATSPMGNVALAMTFAGDSAKGRMTLGGETRDIAIGAAHSALASDALLLVALPKLPLAEGWTGRAEFLNPIGGGVVPVTLRVTGSERVTVPAGPFDSWVVRADAGAVGGSTTYYVAKHGGVAKISVAVPQMGDAVVELTLTK